MSDLISRQAAIDALNGIINRFEQILRDIRESKGDDSVCGMCEYDGAFVGESGDWINECPGFEKEDCFRLSDECRKRWLESVELPAAQKALEQQPCEDTISRQAAIDAVGINTWAGQRLLNVPSAQPEPIKINIKDFNKEDWERLKKEWGNTPITVLPSAQETRQSRH